MKKELLALKVIETIASLRQIDNSEKEDITERIIASTPEEEKGWQQLIDVSADIKLLADEEERQEELSKKLGKLVEARITKVKNVKTSAKKATTPEDEDQQLPMEIVAHPTADPISHFRTSARTQLDKDIAHMFDDKEES